MSSDLTSDDKLWAMLAYLPLVGWIIAIVALIMEDKKARPFIKFHSIQGLILAVVNGILASVLTPVLLLGVCTGIAGAVYMLYIGYKAYLGESVSVPFFTDFIKNQGWG
jgi:uncharacterized membrane protein